MSESLKTEAKPDQEQNDQALLVAAKEKMGEIFDGATPKERFEFIMKRVSPYLEARIFDEETNQKISDEIKSATKIDSKELFINTMMEILQPLFDFRANNRKKFDEVRRERKESVVVNEAVYYEIDYSDQGKYIRIHLSAPQGESMTDKKKLFKKAKEAFTEIARLMEKDESIKFISGTSPLIAQNSRFAEQVGFEDIKPISEELRRAHFREETKPVSGGTIPREKFIEKYGK
jgi:hypothetical protein